MTDQETIEQLKSINTSLTKNVLRLGDECRELDQKVKALAMENGILEGRVLYWKIEAECDHGRWIRTLEDLNNLRKLK